MRRSAEFASAGSRPSSRTVLASVFELVVLALVVSCGGVSQAQSIPFMDHGSTQQSAHEGAPRIAVATDPSTLGLGDLASRDSGRLYIAAFAGSQRTGGYAIRVLRIDRSGDTLTVRAMFSSPGPGALTIQVLTSPAALVSIDRNSAGSAREVILIDQSAAERARGTVPQSTP